MLFLVLLWPAVYGNNHTQIYYNIDKSLPSSLASKVDNKELEDVFDMNTVHIALLKNGASKLSDGSSTFASGTASLLRRFTDIDGSMERKVKLIIETAPVKISDDEK